MFLLLALGVKPIFLLIIALTLVLKISCGPDLSEGRQNIGPNSPSSPNQSTPGEDTTRIIIIDVGQGNAAAIIPPSKEAIFIDVGPKDSFLSSIKPILDKQEIKSINSIILTHYHEDHMGSIQEFLNNTQPPEAIYDRGEPDTDPQSPIYPVYERLAADLRHGLDPGDKIRAGDCDLEIVAANGRVENQADTQAVETTDENSKSIAILMSCNQFKMFFAGDITGGGGSQEYPTIDLETGVGKIIGDIDVLVVAHHGSNTSTNEQFLELTTPEVAIISVGDNNDYFQPHKSVMERLELHDIDVYLTNAGAISGNSKAIIGGNITINVDPEGGYSININGNWSASRNVSVRRRHSLRYSS